METRQMSTQFGESLKKLRTDKSLSQTELADRLFVDRSTIARWETGSRIPDASMIIKIAKILGTDVGTLMTVAAEKNETPRVILLDDEKIIMQGSIAILKETLPKAEIIGFTVPSEALSYAEENKVDLAFLDIKMGRISGLDVCKELLDFNPKMNVIFLTAYTDYSLDAWGTGASGFMLKPLTAEGVREQLAKLRYPLITGGQTE
ncbi:MAG: response regulator [Ruminococcaceae bacterium]|nr:response regulator [Oscillospiraceae bacterium]